MGNLKPKRRQIKPNRQPPLMVVFVWLVLFYRFCFSFPFPILHTFLCLLNPIRKSRSYLKFRCVKWKNRICWFCATIPIRNVVFVRMRIVATVNR